MWTNGCDRRTMRQAIDSLRGRRRYSQRITRLCHRGRTKDNTKWSLNCMVHNIEKLANTGEGAKHGR